jgi:preprotein translocase subunit Sec61beta
MSSRRERRRSAAPMPSAGAGLLRFFEADSPGIQVKPFFVVIIAIALIIFSVVAQLPL